MTTSTMGVWAAAMRRLREDPDTINLLDRAREIQAEQERRDGFPRSARVREMETALVALRLDHYGEIA